MKSRLAKKILTCQSRFSESYSHVVKARAVSKKWQGWLDWPPTTDFYSYWKKVHK